MGRKGKKSGEKGSPQGQQASPAASKGGRPSPGDASRDEVPKEKTSKKQKSPLAKSSREQDLGKAKNENNGRDSFEDVKKSVRQKRKTSQGGATAKATVGCCSLCCVVVLSILVAVASIAAYTAYTAYPTESEQLIGELETQVRRVVRSVNEFVTTNLEKILNTDPKAADKEKTSKTHKSTDDGFVEDDQHLGESSKEEEEEEEEHDSTGKHGSKNIEEFDDDEPPIAMKKASHLEDEKNMEAEQVVDDRETVTPETMAAESLEETVKQEVKENPVEENAEFEEQVDDGLKGGTGELDDEDDVMNWEMAEDSGNTKEEETGRPLEKSAGDAGEIDREPELQYEEPLKTEHVGSKNEEVSEQGDVREPETIHQKPGFPEAAHLEEPVQEPSVQETEAPPEIAPSHEQTEKEVYTQEVPQVTSELPEQQTVPAEEVPEEAIQSQEVLEEEQPAHGSQSGNEPEVVIPSEDLPPQEIPSHGEPEPQLPSDIPEHVDQVEEAERTGETLSTPSPEPEIVKSDLKAADSDPSVDPKLSEKIVYEEGGGQRADETELDRAEVHEEVKEIRQDVEEAARDSPKEPDVSLGHSADEAVEEVNASELPNVADSAEVQLEKELDYIDGIIDEMPREAIEKYDRILSVFPMSPRAIIGRAKALGVLADKEQSDSILEQSIAEYLKLFSIPSVPKPQMVEAGRACAERQTIRGWGGAAAQTLHSLVSMYPDDLVLYNELGQKYLMNGAYDEARATFKEILNRDPNDAFAMLYLGFIMKAVDRELVQSLDFMRKGLVTVPISDLKFYVELGEALTRSGRHNEALEVYQLAVDRRLLKSIWQRSWFNVEGLSARPWWTPEKTNNIINLQVLEDFKNVIREEANSILVNHSSLFVQDNRDIVESGDMKHMKLYVNGRKVTENCDAAVKTCSLLDAFSDAIECRQCEVKFSLMGPGLHLHPHCGPTNCRLTVHLPLVVSPQSRIRVADETRTYGDNALLIFDDSFEQELWVTDNASQLLLIVEMWHSELTFEQKSTLGPL